MFLRTRTYAGGSLPEIIPCPYCGRKPMLYCADIKLAQSYGTIIRCTWKIQCPDCVTKTEATDYRLRDSGEFEIVRGGPAALIEKWNRRVDNG